MSVARWRYQYPQQQVNANETDPKISRLWLCSRKQGGERRDMVPEAPKTAELQVSGPALLRFANQG